MPKHTEEVVKEFESAGGGNLQCLLCHTEISEGYKSKHRHMKGHQEGYLEAAKAQRKLGIHIHPKPADPSQSHCDACDVDISSSSKTTHSQTKSHKENFLIKAMNWKKGSKLMQEFKMVTEKKTAGYGWMPNTKRTGRPY